GLVAPVEWKMRSEPDARDARDGSELQPNRFDSLGREANRRYRCRDDTARVEAGVGVQNVGQRSDEERRTDEQHDGRGHLEAHEEPPHILPHDPHLAAGRPNGVTRITSGKAKRRVESGDHRGHHRHTAHECEDDAVDRQLIETRDESRPQDAADPPTRHAETTTPRTAGPANRSVTSLPRVAPSAARTATSRWRASPRVSCALT